MCINHGEINFDDTLHMYSLKTLKRRYAVFVCENISLKSLAFEIINEMEHIHTLKIFMLTVKNYTIATDGIYQFRILRIYELNEYK